jgi:hypothetical protein
VVFAPFLSAVAFGGQLYCTGFLFCSSEQEPSRICTKFFCLCPHSTCTGMYWMPKLNFIRACKELAQLPFFSPLCGWLQISCLSATGLARAPHCWRSFSHNSLVVSLRDYAGWSHCVHWQWTGDDVLLDEAGGTSINDGSGNKLDEVES